MAWAEWEQLKTDAAAKSGAQMQLNKAGPGGGGGKKGDLTVNDTNLSGVRDEASKLNGRLWKEARVAVPTSETAAGGLTTQGFALGGALQHVADRWDVQTYELVEVAAKTAGERSGNPSSNIVASVASAAEKGLPVPAPTRIHILTAREIRQSSRRRKNNDEKQGLHLRSKSSCRYSFGSGRRLPA
ncbi:hypothetical protein ABT001_13835 [Streptomyces sp. NPDC002793]|uniref:hypothetical protein n=1 Tax=Streptomyces sp. NPDC002793 TaxID=3154432 RepID=UPI0033341154